MSEKTVESAQSRFWRGEFGDAYVDRNAPTPERLRSYSFMWGRIIGAMAGAPPRSVLEVGANIGLNLRALRSLTGAEFYAVEPNARARETLVQDRVVAAANTFDATAERIPLPAGAVDFAFTCGVLIHVHPDDLLRSCSEIHRVSRRWVACIEYFSDRPEEIAYRDHQNVLFKRDFGDFWLSNFPDLQVVDYGFFWKRVTGLDNLTWWLFRKS